LNRNLFVFSLLLVLAGIAVGFYLISFIGFILMIPSLLSPSRPPAGPPARTGSAPPQTQPRQIPRRVSPPQVPQQQQVTPTTPAKAEVAMPPLYSASSPSPMASSMASYSSALFPSPILPALSQITPVPRPTKEKEQQNQGERDELVEVGTMLALLKLILG